MSLQDKRIAYVFFTARMESLQVHATIDRRNLRGQRYSKVMYMYMYM